MLLIFKLASYPDYKCLTVFCIFQSSDSGYPSIPGRHLSLSRAAWDHDGPSSHAGRQQGTVSGSTGQPPDATHLLSAAGEKDKKLQGSLKIFLVAKWDLVDIARYYFRMRFLVGWSASWIEFNYIRRTTGVLGPEKSDFWDRIGLYFLGPFFLDSYLSYLGVALNEGDLALNKLVWSHCDRRSNPFVTLTFSKIFNRYVPQKALENIKIT